MLVPRLAACFALWLLTVAPSAAQPPQAEPLARPLAIVGLALALLGFALVQANGYLKLRREVRRSRHLQRRIDEVSANLPVVVFQARRERDGRLHLDTIAGDAPQLFSASPFELQTDPSRLLAAISASDRQRVLTALMRAVHRVCPVTVRFTAHGVRGIRSIAMYAWPMLDRSIEQRWTGYWMDVSDAHGREQEIARAHAQAAEDAGERVQLVTALGVGIGEPMQVLLQRLALLHTDTLDRHQRAALASLEDASTMLSRILADVVTLSSGSETQMAFQASSVDLRRLLENMQTLLRPAAFSKGLDLDYRIDQRVDPALKADGTRLRQILFNLVGNAIKFTAHGGVSLVVQVLDDGVDTQRLRIAVKDTGVGIALDRQEAVFEPFAQADAATTRHHGGTGLGLGICRQLVRRMGGQLLLRSAPGQGTTVDVELEFERLDCAPGVHAQPAAQPMGAGPPPAAPAEAPAPPRSVLVAEDHPTQQRLMQWWLRGLDLEVEVAADGAEAFELWRGGHHALVLTDDRMPGLNGAELVARIRLEERSQGRARVPIIGMSADIDGMHEVALDHVLAKPISRRSLVDAVMIVLPALLAAQHGPALQATDCADALDLAVLVNRFGNEAIARELVHSLRTSMEEDLAALRREWNQMDTRPALLRLHRMAGGAGSLGLGALAAHLRALSDSATALDGAQRHTLQHRLQRCIAHLRQLEG